MSCNALCDAIASNGRKILHSPIRAVVPTIRICAHCVVRVLRRDTRPCVRGLFGYRRGEEISGVGVYFAVQTTTQTTSARSSTAHTRSRCKYSRSGSSFRTTGRQTRVPPTAGVTGTNESHAHVPTCGAFRIFVECHRATYG